MASVKATVTVNAQGRMTIPAEIRRELGIAGQTVLTIETEDGRLVVKPFKMPLEDTWAYTPEFRARLARIRAQIAAGEILRGIGEDDIRAWCGLPPKAQDPYRDEDDDA